MKIKSILTFKWIYLILALTIFLIELGIATWVTGIIRTFGGDFLVVGLLYCLLAAFWKSKAINIAISVLVFAFAVEIAQYFEIVKLLGLEGNRLASIIIGTQFDWLDLLAYLLGILFIYQIDTRWIRKH